MRITQNEYKDIFLNLSKQKLPKQTSVMNWPQGHQRVKITPNIIT